MNNIRLFFSKSLSLNLIDKLDKPQSHYLCKVMRLNINQNFSLFNSSGEWEAKILDLTKNIVQFNITKQLRQKENDKELWLAFSPIKSNYFNFMIQKATELGVTKFFPIVFERSIVRKINKDRLQKIIIEASEQSNRINIPEIKNLKNLSEFLKNFPDNGNLIFCDINSRKEKIDTVLSKKRKGAICILIGPEGDFSEIERQSIIDIKQSTALSLAHNILRSETAAIAAISIINFHL